MMRSRKRLAEPWRRIHGALWLIGLAILFWRGWWWPGIFVLIALSALLEAAIQIAVPEAVIDDVDRGNRVGTGRCAPPSRARPVGRSPEVGTAEHRVDLLPSECPKCGAPVRGSEVRWRAAKAADCAYCGANLPMKAE